MKNRAKATKAVQAHYEAAAKDYHLQYDRERLTDLSVKYPANYFRLQLLMNSFAKKGLKRVIEVGVGEGTPLATVGKAGLDVWGFDLSEEMVGKAKQSMERHGLNADQIFLGDIQDPATYAHAVGGEPFDGLMAMGVMPHIEDEDRALDNMASLLRPGGSVFIEFRNTLFSLFTFNRHTKDFILNDLLKGVDPGVKANVEQDLDSRLRMDMPPVRSKIEGTDAPGYDAILSKFHNPLEVPDLFEQNGFEDIQLLWYHYHPAMPYLTEKDPKAFRSEAIRLEKESPDWRGIFLCSAFVVEAVKGT